MNTRQQSTFVSVFKIVLATCCVISFRGTIEASDIASAASGVSQIGLASSPAAASSVVADHNHDTMVIDGLMGHSQNERDSTFGSFGGISSSQLHQQPQITSHSSNQPGGSHIEESYIDYSDPNNPKQVHQQVNQFIQQGPNGHSIQNSETRVENSVNGARNSFSRSSSFSRHSSSSSSSSSHGSANMGGYTSVRSGDGLVSATSVAGSMGSGDHHSAWQGQVPYGPYQQQQPFQIGAPTWGAPPTGAQYASYWPFQAPFVQKHAQASALAVSDSNGFGASISATGSVHDQTELPDSAHDQMAYLSKRARRRARRALKRQLALQHEAISHEKPAEYLS